MSCKTLCESLQTAMVKQEEVMAEVAKLPPSVAQSLTDEVAIANVRVGAVAKVMSADESEFKDQL
eukprot:4075648-Amphidinium_carterae.1